MQPRVLIADDDPGVRYVLRRFMSGRGWAVQAVADAEAAIEAALQDPPDLLLLDIYLPRGGGLEVLYELQRVGSEVPVVAFSAAPDDRMARDVLLLGAKVFVKKPFNIRRLDEVLAPLLPRPAETASVLPAEAGGTKRAGGSIPDVPVRD